MKTILINLFSDRLVEEDFEYFTNTVPGEKEVFNYCFPVNNLYPDIVEVILNALQNEFNINAREIGVIFQTNIADIAHFTLRFYSELIDAVVIAPKNIEILSEVQNEYMFIKDIFYVDNKDFRLNSVYINNTDKVDTFYLNFLYEHFLLNEVKPLSEFKIEDSKKMNFDLLFRGAIGIETNFILQEQKSFEVEKKQINHIYSIIEPYGAFLFLEFITNLETLPIEEKKKIIHIMLLNFKEANGKKKIDCLINCILEFLQNGKYSFGVFVDYNYCSMFLGDEDGLKRQYNFLKENYERLNPINIHALITNSLAYVSLLNQKEEKAIVQDRLFLMNKINQFLLNHVQTQKEFKRTENKIAIVAGQLLSIKHSPTKWTIDYANALKRYNPELEIKIFVEDWANYSKDDLLWINTFNSAKSKNSELEHSQYLHPKIKVHYSNDTLNRIDRIQNDFDAIANFNPTIIYKMGACYYPVTDLLFPYYPIVSHTLGGAEDCEFVDIFTGGYLDEDMKNMYQEKWIHNQKYYSHRVGMEPAKSENKRIRSMYNLNKEDFVLITVGNRLGSEITEEFVKQIKIILDQDIKYKWLIVGVSSNLLIETICTEVINNQQIQFIPYEKYLFDLYEICDVYVNPIRKSGGHSAAIAMQASLPVITTDSKSDVGTFVGAKNCLQIEDFSKEILKLGIDRKYYKEKSETVFKEMNEKYSLKNTVEDLMGIFSKAIFKKNERVQN